MYSFHRMRVLILLILWGALALLPLNVEASIFQDGLDYATHAFGQVRVLSSNILMWMGREGIKLLYLLVLLLALCLPFCLA